MDARLASLLLRLVDLRGDSTIQMTHDDVAAELGYRPRGRQPLLKEFERAGALRLSRARLTIVGPAILADLASSASASLK
jgi:CRP/FNR family transcriptional regulator, anaerobic regulatory protein